MPETLSIGIIGGADGPTAIFVTGRFPWEAIILAVICAIAILWFAKRKR